MVYNLESQDSTAGGSMTIALLSAGTSTQILFFYIPDQAALYDSRAGNQNRAMGVYQLDQRGVRG